MGRAQARTIMERKWVRPAVPDRREPGAGPSGRPYFRSSVRALLSTRNDPVQNLAKRTFGHGSRIGHPFWMHRVGSAQPTAGPVATVVDLVQQIASSSTAVGPASGREHAAGSVPRTKN